MEKFTGTDARNLWWITIIKPPSSDDRIHLKTILIDDGWAIRTDGHRLFGTLLIRPAVPDGMYYIIKRAKNNFQILRDATLDHKTNYPNWRNIFPHHTEHNHRTIPVANANTAAIVLFKNNIYLDLKYIIDLFKDDCEYDLRLYKGTNKSPAITFSSGDHRLALIMPLRHPS